MPKYLLFCKYVILLVSFEGILCAHLDFEVPEFSAADTYDVVVVEQIDQDVDELKFVFEKSNAEVKLEYEVPFSKIKWNTAAHEPNNRTVISFDTVDSSFFENVNLKFEDVSQAHHFLQNGRLPEGCQIVWGMIYSHWYKIYIVYDQLENEQLENGDLGFKFVSNPNDQEEIEREKYFFQRSYIDNSVQFVNTHKLLMRNKTYSEDYHITFSNADHRNRFLELFPNNSNDTEGESYYYIPVENL